MLSSAGSGAQWKRGSYGLVVIGGHPSWSPAFLLEFLSLSRVDVWGKWTSSPLFKRHRAGPTDPFTFLLLKLSAPFPLLSGFMIYVYLLERRITGFREEWMQMWAQCTIFNLKRQLVIYLIDFMQCRVSCFPSLGMTRCYAGILLPSPLHPASEPCSSHDQKNHLSRFYSSFFF